MFTASTVFVILGTSAEHCCTTCDASAGLAKYTLLVRTGQFLAEVTSAFVAEAVALEWALQYLTELIRGKVAVAARV